MKTNTKRITALFLAVIMILSTLPVLTASAANVAEKGKLNKNISWTLYNDGKLVISGKGKTGAFSLDMPYMAGDYVPGVFELYGINNKIKTAEIKNGVTNIRNFLFTYCPNLKSVTIPESVTEIGEVAFMGCESLKKITIPKSVTKISSDAFSGCSSLQSINVNKNNKKFASVNGMLCNKNKTTVIKCPEAMKNIQIPKGTKKIGNSAFAGCSKLSKISIPKSVTSIGAYAFVGTPYYNNTKKWKDGSLYIDNCLIDASPTVSSYKIKSGTRVIADYAFFVFDDDVLKNITIPASVVNIGDTAFVNCRGLKKINVNNKNKKYSSVDGILYNKNKTTLVYCPANKTKVSVPKTVTKIANYAFYGNQLKTITLPNGVKSIGDYAFESCYNLKSVTLPQGVTSIGEYAFAGCRIKNITIPKNVKNIAKGAFCCDLKSIKILNAKCKIYNHRETIYPLAKIYGYKNSTAQTYAEKYNRKFVKL